MSEMRLQLLPPPSGAPVDSLLGKNPKEPPGVMKQPLTGKSFYLDLPAGKNLQFLMRAIQELGGVIESFLSKEVNYIITSRREPKAEKSALGHQGFTSLRKRHVEMTSPADPKGNQNFSHKPRECVPMSRGKELLQKAIKNQGSTSCSSGGSSSLLANARSWGVQILHVDEMLMHVQQLCLGILHLTEKEQERKKTKKTCTAMESRAPKVARLKVPFLKIEDSSRKFQPFYHQFRCFPDLNFLGSKGTSPFETLRISLHKRKTKDLEGDELSPQSTACTVPRRKKGYCECCQEDYQELNVHLQSDQHRGFATEASNYMAVDQIASQLSNNFAELSTQMLPPWLPGSPAVGLEHHSSCSLQKSPPSHAPDARVSSPRTNGAPREDRLSSGALSLLTPMEQTSGGKATGAEDSKRLGHLGETILNSSGEPSLAHQLTLVCSSSVELLANPPCCDRPTAPPFLSEQDGSLTGHKRKLQSPNCRAEKKLRVPVDTVPCSSISDTPAMCPPTPEQEQRDTLSPSPFLTTNLDILLASPIGATHKPALPFPCSSPSKPQGEPLCSGVPDLEADALTKMSLDMHRFSPQEGAQRAARLSPCWASTPCPDHHSQPSHPACQPAPLPPTASSSEQRLQGASFPLSVENAVSPPPCPPSERQGSPSTAPAPLLPAKASPLLEHCSSESEWDTQLLSKLERPQASRDRSLDAEGLRRARVMILDSGYESHLYSVLQPKPELDWERKEEQNQGSCRAETEGAPFVAFETCLDTWTS
ncbi:protein DBF4 homolog B [Monodelphis domestica]|uniref:protein DBF4 homolog B n=1 Tax=Monodelphis domestica TaxID=13616 RepID=UPI0024E25361|nr:protein DBF4 homolog B [Monodelphis domestica]XP_056672937.1 protein DBF4 homolog B [Monodelphis domestica]